MGDFKKLILDEFHKLPYSWHPSHCKMITAINKLCHWMGMKREVVEYIAKCLECM